MTPVEYFVAQICAFVAFAIDQDASVHFESSMRHKGWRCWTTWRGAAQ